MCPPATNSLSPVRIHALRPHAFVIWPSDKPMRLPEVKAKPRPVPFSQDDSSRCKKLSKLFPVPRRSAPSISAAPGSSAVATPGPRQFDRHAAPVLLAAGGAPPGPGGLQLPNCSLTEALRSSMIQRSLCHLAAPPPEYSSIHSRLSPRPVRQIVAAAACQASNRLSPIGSGSGRLRSRPTVRTAVGARSRPRGAARAGVGATSLALVRAQGRGGAGRAPRSGPWCGPIPCPWCVPGPGGGSFVNRFSIHYTGYGRELYSGSFGILPS